MRHDAPFDVLGYKVVTRRSQMKGHHVQAIVDVRCRGANVRKAGTGVGPVHALDAALRSCLLDHFPELGEVRLTDYSVSMVDDAGTSSKVRVTVEATDGIATWDAGCTSPNIIDASFEALCSLAVMGIIRSRSKALRSA